MILIKLHTAGAPVREVRAAGPTITLGRDAQSTVVLEDPTKHISRLHATIEQLDGGWVITVHSRVNPVLVDGTVMRTGQTLALRDGSRVTMSPYELTVGFLMAGVQGDAVAATGPAAGAAPQEPSGVCAPALVPGPTSLANSAADAPHAQGPGARPDSRPAEVAPAPAGGEAAAAVAAGLRATNGAEAFLAGMGLAGVRIAADEEAAFLRQAGQIVRATVEALMQTQAARDELRRALQAEDPTMVAARNDNALKLMSSADEALDWLFDPAKQTPGWLPPPLAVKDLARDLRAHEQALVAGMRAAVLGAVRRFDPAGFEQAAAKAAGPLAINRRGKAWEAYVEAYAKLELEAAQSLDRVLQRDFLRAYAEEMLLRSR